MKKYKITVFGADRGVIEVREVIGTPVNVPYGFAAFVHRRVDGDKKGWCVSERTTGNIITTGRTKVDAIVNAREKILELGEQNMRFAITRVLKVLEDHKINLYEETIK